LPSDVLKILKTLIEVDTSNPPGDIDRYREILEKVRSYLPEDSDVKEIEVDDVPTLVATRGKGDKNIVFNGHVDVVPANRENWSRDPFSISKDGDRVYGRGVSDMKGGLAAIIQAFRELDPRESRVTLIANPEEETGGEKGIIGLKEILDWESFDFWVSAEPTLLKVNRCEKGAFWFEVTARGKSAHGSKPEEGINAIEGIATLINSIKDLFSKKEREHPLLGGATINTGVIRGGEKVNIVAEECTVSFDRRTLPWEEMEEVSSEIRNLAGEILGKEKLEWDVEPILEARPFEIPESNDLVQVSVKAVEEVTGTAPEICGFSGFTDGRVPANLGIPTIILGPGDMNESHTNDESASVELIETSVDVYKRIARSLNEIR